MTTETVNLALTQSEAAIVLRALDALGTPGATALLLRLRALMGETATPAEEQPEDQCPGASAYGIPLLVCKEGRTAI